MRASQKRQTLSMSHGRSVAELEESKIWIGARASMRRPCHAQLARASARSDAVVGRLVFGFRLLAQRSGGCAQALNRVPHGRLLDRPLGAPPPEGDRGGGKAAHRRSAR